MNVKGYMSLWKLSWMIRKVFIKVNKNSCSVRLSTKWPLMTGGKTLKNKDSMFRSLHK